MATRRATPTARRPPPRGSVEPPSALHERAKFSREGCPIVDLQHNNAILVDPELYLQLFLTDACSENDERVKLKKGGGEFVLLSWHKILCHDFLNLITINYF